MTGHTIRLLEGHTHEDLGLIPHFIDQDDDRPAREQFDERYAHGGGWRPIKGFERLDGSYTALQYPGDPPIYPIAAFALRDEMIVVYPMGLVAIMQSDGSFEVARMD